MRLENYIKENNGIESIVEVSMFLEDFDYMNEGIGDFLGKVKSFLPNIGIHAHKSGSGLVQILSKAGKHMAKFFWHAMKAATGNEESKKIVKEMANKEVKKGDIIDFLIKLDTVTLHLVSGPIHMIEALTGWHIGAHIKSDIKNVMTKAKDAIETLKNIAKDAEQGIRKKILQYINGLRRLIGLESV
jgi:hypothetical protein